MPCEVGTLVVVAYLGLILVLCYESSPDSECGVSWAAPSADTPNEGADALVTDIASSSWFIVLFAAPS